VPFVCIIYYVVIVVSISCVRGQREEFFELFKEPCLRIILPDIYCIVVVVAVCHTRG